MFGSHVNFCFSDTIQYKQFLTEKQEGSFINDVTKYLVIKLCKVIERLQNLFF